MQRNSNFDDNSIAKVIALVPFVTDHDHNLQVQLHFGIRNDKQIGSIPSDCEEAAKTIILNEDKKRFITNETSVFIEWKSQLYLGSLRRLYPERRDIAYIGKTSAPVRDEVIREMKKLQPDRVTLVADPEMDLSGKWYTVSFVNDRISKMSSEQEEFFKSQPEIRATAI